MLRAWLPRATGLLAGASLAAFAAAFVGAYPWWALLMPLTVGNWLAAGALCLLLLPACASTRLVARLGPPAAWTWTGVALGLVPLPSATEWVSGPLAYAIGAALALALVVAAHRRQFRAPPLRALVVIVVVTPPLALAFGFHHDHQLELAMHAAAAQESVLAAETETPLAVAQDAPDLILISVDTLRADAIVGPRPAGYEIPWFDELRARGTWWDYALSSSNQTVPGHASMLTGRDAIASAVRWNRDLLPGSDHAPLLSEFLQQNGYRTLGVISNDLLSGALGFDRGYDLYDDSTVPRLSLVNGPLAWHARNSWLGLLLDDRVVHAFLVRTQFFAAQKPPRGLGGHGRIARGTVTSDQALAALEQAYAQTRPFFLFLHYFDPHQPYGAPPPYAGRLTGALPPIAPAYAASVKHGLFGSAEIERAQRDLRAADPAVRAAARAAVERFHLTYLERIMFLDAELRRVEERLAASGRPYVILLTADHGEHFGEHDAMLHGTTLYEEAIRVPMILAGPGIAAGVRGEGVPALEDVAPTLLALAGIPPPATMSGRLLAREGAGTAGRAHVAADNKRVSWRLDGWKAHGHWTGKQAADPVALYHVADDPREERDRLREGLPTALRDALVRLLARDLYEASQKAIGYAHQFMLDQLGYAEAAAATQPD